MAGRAQNMPLGGRSPGRWLVCVGEASHQGAALAHGVRREACVTDRAMGSQLKVF